MFQISIFIFNTRTLFTLLFVRVGILLTCGKYLHDRISFHLKGRFGPIQLAYSRTLCIEVSMLSQESKRLCICVLKVSNLPLCAVCLLYFGNVLTLWYLLLIFGN